MTDDHYLTDVEQGALEEIAWRLHDSLGKLRGTSPVARAALPDGADEAMWIDGAVENAGEAYNAIVSEMERRSAAGALDDHVAVPPRFD